MDSRAARVLMVVMFPRVLLDKMEPLDLKDVKVGMAFKDAKEDRVKMVPTLHRVLLVV